MSEEQLDMLGAWPADDEALAAAAPAHKWPRQLVELLEVTEAALQRAGLPEGEAFRLARLAVLAQARHAGGRALYLPCGESVVRALRDAEIYRQAHRDNLDALAKTHGLTVPQIYRILRTQRALHRRRIQPELPLPAVHGTK